MSWDIILFNSYQKISSVEEIDEKLLIEFDFDFYLKDFFKKINSTNNHNEVIEDGFTIDFFDDEPSSNKMISLYGEKAFFEIAKFAQKYNLQIYDSGIDRLIDFEELENDGFEHFNNYLNRILKNDV